MSTMTMANAIYNAKAVVRDLQGDLTFEQLHEPEHARVSNRLLALRLLIDVARESAETECENCRHRMPSKVGPDLCSELHDRTGAYQFCDDVGPCGLFRKEDE